jgi:NTE family protein
MYMDEQAIIGVFEGGGIKGVALAGAAAATMDSGYRFERIVGTSAGALVGALVAAGYTSSELKRTVCSIDWPGLLDPSWLARIPLVGKQLAVFFQLGLYQGVSLEQTWADLLAAKGVKVFGDLDVRLRVVATDITHTRGLVFPDAFEVLGVDPETIPVAKAVRISASIPFAFQPVKLRNERTRDDFYVVDGALAANFPERIVDPNASIPAVGFRFLPAESHPHRQIRGPLSLAAAVMWSGVGAREGLPALQSKVVDVIDVPSRLSGLDFNITSAEAALLFEESYVAVRDRLASTPLQIG